MELMWEKLISNYPKDSEGHPSGANTFGGSGGSDYYKKLFIVNNKVVFIQQRSWRSTETGPHNEHIIIVDAFDMLTSDRERSIFTYPPKLKYFWDCYVWNCYVKDDKLYINPVAYVKPNARMLKENYDPEEDKNVFDELFFDKLLCYSNGAFTVHGIAPIEQHEYFSEKVYEFGEYQIYASNAYSISCRLVSTKEDLWKMRHGVSGLRTPIEEKNGIIFFGTSDNGGHFYALSLATGEVLCDINNGGCEHYAWYKDKVCIKSKKGDLLMFNPLSDEEPQNLKLPNGKLGDYSPIFIYKDYLFTIVDKKKKNGAWDRYFALCVQLSI